MKRVVFDLKFWRRFISAEQQMGFQYMLGDLPTNNIKLASDACTSYGMAGILTFDLQLRDETSVAGLF